MYSFIAWSDAELRRRFDAMADAELHPELLVVAHRLIEHMLKRVLRCELAGRGLCVRKKVGGVSLVSANTVGELDASLHEQVESMRTLERVWRVAMVKSVEPNLPAPVDRRGLGRAR